MSHIRHATCELIDDAFRHARRQLVVEFSGTFDDWVDRARQLPALPTVSHWLADVGRASARTAIARSHQEHAQEQVLTLARLCRDFVFGELRAWTFLQRRRGVSVDEVLSAAVPYAAEAEDAAYECKWTVGLSQIGSLNVDRLFAAWDGSPRWIEEIWRVMVVEQLVEVIEEWLPWALNQSAATPRRTRLIASRTPQLDRIEQFLVAVRCTTNRRITKQDIWQLAGYRDRREFQRFQAGKGTRMATKKFERVLRQAPATVVEQLIQLERRRTGHAPQA